MGAQGHLVEPAAALSTSAGSTKQRNTGRHQTDSARAPRFAGGSRRFRSGLQHRQRLHRPDGRACDTKTLAPAKLSAEGILKTMMADMAQPTVQERGCTVLYDMAKRGPTAQDEIAALKGIEILLKVLETHPSVQNVQMLATCALHRVCVGHEENTMHLASLGGMKSIVLTMAEHLAMQSLQEVGCRSLRNAAACNQLCQTKAATAGGIPAVLRAMAAHVGAASVQEAACQALKELAVYDAGNQESIVSEGGIPAVLRAMETHIALPSIQVLACGVFRNITACNAEYQECVVSRVASRP